MEAAPLTVCNESSFLDIVLSFQAGGLSDTYIGNVLEQIQNQGVSQRRWIGKVLSGNTSGLCQQHKRWWVVMLTAP
jgi:hypothetical protein